MSEIVQVFKALKLYGMAQCWAERANWCDYVGPVNGKVRQRDQDLVRVHVEGVADLAAQRPFRVLQPAAVLRRQVVRRT